MAVNYAALKAGGFMLQMQKNNFSLRLRCVGGTVTAEQLATITAAVSYTHLTLPTILRV